MENYFENIEDIIGKYLAGEASADEISVVEKWIGESEENRKVFDQYKQLFDKSAQVVNQQQYDVDAAWNSVKERIESKKRIVPIKINYASYWRVAASILVIVSAGLLAYNYLIAPQDVQFIESYTEAVEQVLPDGTETFLNKQSSISYHYSPIKKERVVTLKGEAFFDVKREDKKQFLIETDELIIKDIGTRFNVKAYPEANVVEVYVQEGVVVMYTNDNPGLNLQAGETGVYDKTTKEFKKLERENENAIAYKTKSFVFKSSTLNDLVATINEVYPVKIKLENQEIGHCPITVSFDDESVETIAEIIAETLNLELTKSGNEILLRGEGCGKQ